MYKISFCLLCTFLCLSGFAQEIVNYAMVGDQGVTQDPKEAKYLILIKHFADGSFERVEYNFRGPLIRVLTFADAQMKQKEGAFKQYDDAGFLSQEGQYHLGKKEGDWYQFDDSLQEIQHVGYHQDSILFIWGPDSIQIHKALDDSLQKADTVKKVEREAAFKGGDRGWVKYFSNKANEKYPDRARSLGAAGTVHVQFVIDTMGHVSNAYLVQSVEMSLDETVLNVLYHSPAWTPAFQKDHKVKAYRRQKITYQLPE